MPSCQKGKRLISVENLYKIFGEDPHSVLPLLAQGRDKDDIRAETGHTVGVNDVSFQLEPGEFFVIMGLSGSGKSTLLRCINRLIDPTAGSVTLETDDGTINLTELTGKQLREVRRKHISMVFQRFGLFPHRTVRANAAYGLEVQGRAKKARLEAAQKTLEMVGLGDWGDAYPDELSGGMQQRVGLARALATDAPVLLMDEPFSALDPLIKVNMQQELLSIERELHRTILFITHDLDEALKLGHRIAIMEGGRVVQIGTPEEIIVNPKTDYVADFVEYADPTGVITAYTVAVPLTSDKLLTRGGAASRHYQHPGVPDVEFVIGDDGALQKVISDGAPIVPQRLEDVLERDPPAVRVRDLVLTVPQDATLRDILKGRNYSSLPMVIRQDDGSVHGLVSERELIQGILNKNGYADTERPLEVSR